MRQRMLADLLARLPRNIAMRDRLLVVQYVRRARRPSSKENGGSVNVAWPRPRGWLSSLYHITAPNVLLVQRNSLFHVLPRRTCLRLRASSVQKRYIMIIDSSLLFRNRIRSQLSYYAKRIIGIKTVSTFLSNKIYL